MNVPRVLGVTAMVCVWLSSWLCAQQAGTGPKVTPQKEPLAIPIALAPGGPARSLECIVARVRSNPLAAVAFSPDGKTLAVGGYQEVVAWDLENAKLLKRLGSGQLGPFIGALAFLKDGGLLAVGDGVPQSSGAVRILDFQTGKQTVVFKEPKDVVSCLAVSPDGKLLAAGGAEPVARVWSVPDKKLLKTIREHTDWVVGVAFSREGKLFATAGADKSARVWEVETWSSVARLPEVESVRGVAFGPAETTLALAVGGPGQRGLRFRQTDNIRTVRPVSTGAATPLGVVWSRQNNRIYAPCTDSTVKVFDPNGKPLATLSGHGDWVYSVALCPDETKLASASADGTVKLWNTADGKLIATLLQLSPRADEWLIITAQGYLTASSADAIQWKTENVKMPPQELASLLENPETVRDAIAGKKITPPAVK